MEDDTPKMLLVFRANMEELLQRYPSVNKVCEGTNISRVTILKYRDGIAWPTADALARLCAFFNVSPLVLLIPLAEISVDNRLRLVKATIDLLDRKVEQGKCHTDESQDIVNATHVLLDRWVE